MILARNALALVLAGLILADARLAPAAERAGGAEAAASSRFLRFVDDNEGGGTLQTAIVTYENADGVRVDLISAVHVGETRYYRDLARTFATYDVLLYEMIKPRGAPAPVPGMRSGGAIMALQTTLKTLLELDYQLDAIDYRAPNFVHADLDAETFERMQAERGENIFILMLRQMLAEMSRPQPQAPEVTLAELMVALTSPDRARHFKLILARQFQDLEEKLAGFDGPNGSVLVTERNRKAVQVLKQQIAAGRRNIGIFYGAAHMKGIEEMIAELGFKPTRTEWRVAWDMTAKEGDIIVKVKRAPATRPAE